MGNKISGLDPEGGEYLAEKVENPAGLFSEDGLFKQLKKALTEWILESELTTRLGYEKHDALRDKSGNSRNGYSKKILKTKEEELEMQVPRHRNNGFEPVSIPKIQTRFDYMDEKIISLYSRGMTTRDIQKQLKDRYGVKVSSTRISNVTNDVIDEVKAWQSRPLDKLYPIVYLDALVIKVSQAKRIINKTFYLALGVNLQGKKELLGIWMSQNEDAKFWFNVLIELKNRGLEDIPIVCVGALTGFPEAIEIVYPQTQVQLCIVRMVRNSLRYVDWKDRMMVAGDLKKIYASKTIEEAERALSEFSEKWDKQFPSISKSWLTHWANITPFFVYPDEIRKVIYTTNSIDSLNMCMRKITKNKCIFPSDEAALKQLYLALKNISKKWTMPIGGWGRS